MLIVSLPTSVQVTPSGETYPLKVLPLRTSFTQYGAVNVALRMERSCPGSQPSLESRSRVRGNCHECMVAFAAMVSRIMTPALAHGFVFCSEATRAMIWPLPVSVW